MGVAFATQKRLTFFSAKNINVLAIFQNRNLNVTLAYNFVKIEQLGPVNYEVVVNHLISAGFPIVNQNIALH